MRWDGARIVLLIGMAAAGGCGSRPEVARPAPPDRAAASPAASGEASPAASGAASPAASGEAAAARFDPAETPAARRKRAELHLRQAMVAYKQKDWPAYLAEMQQAAAIEPDRIAHVYNLASALALNGRSAEAVAALERLRRGGVFMDVAADSDFASLAELAAFKDLAAGLSENRTREVGHGKALETVRLKERELIVEGLARDPRDGSWLVSSVHRRKVVRIAAKGRRPAPRDLATAESAGLWSALGLAVDPARRSLWVATAALPQSAGFLPGRDDGVTALVELDLDSGALRRTVRAPDDAVKPRFGDIAVGADGTLYASDHGSGAVYRLAPGAPGLATLVPAGVLLSPQGLTLDAAGGRLYVADYGAGIAAVDLASGAVTLLSAPPDALLAGIDGLVRHGSDLIGIQNGLEPHRILRLSLAADGQRIERAEVLLQNDPRLDEPTLATVDGDTLYFVANSQWRRFERDGTIWPVARLDEPLILRLGLD
jgi:sugar lactone lactonase YvrE